MLCYEIQRGNAILSTFQDYSMEPKSLTFEEMQCLHRALLAAIIGDDDAEELYADLIKRATEYAIIRSKWVLFTRQEKMDIDPRRTSCHDSVIIHFNMLARYLKSIDRDTSWRNVLGYEEDDPFNRKRIGDFACYLAFTNSINAR